MAKIVGNWGGGPIWRMTSGQFTSNTYFCEIDVPGGGILIDAGLDGPAIDVQLNEHGLCPHQVFCTHGHFDHIGSAAYFQKKYGCQVFLHQADERTMRSANFLLMALKIPQKIKLPIVTFVEDEFTIDVKGQVLKYLATPGHTPGSCVIELGNAWFTGDTVYSCGVGLSGLPGEDAGQLKTSIRKLWADLSGQRTIFPGHGSVADGEVVRNQNHELLTFLELEIP